MKTRELHLRNYKISVRKGSAADRALNVLDFSLIVLVFVAMGT